jgi:hypothetical protein
MNAQVKISKALLGITIALFVLTNTVLFIAAYLPGLLINKNRFSHYLWLIFILITISLILIVIGIYLFGAMRNKPKA